jgi:hypothetical protein
VILPQQFELLPIGRERFIRVPGLGALAFRALSVLNPNEKSTTDGVSMRDHLVSSLLHYAMSGDGAISSVIMTSTGIDSIVSKRVLHFEQSHRWRINLPSWYSDFSGAISSSLHRTQFIRKVERRSGTIVATVTCLLSLPRNVSRLVTQSASRF